MNQPHDPADVDEQAIEAWLAELDAALPAAVLGELGPEERVLLLDLARVAARRSHRTAAPLTTYMVGLAMASQAREDRLARMRAIVESLAEPRA